MSTTILAIDIAKEKFYVFGVDANNQVTIDKMLGRKKLLGFLANHAPLEIYMEACAGSNYLCQRFNKMGHKARRIAAQHVKPYVGRQKNDRNDAKAILEAARRPEALFVAIKEQWQQDLQSLHKIRDQKTKQYQAIVNQTRGLLFEYGIVIPQSVEKFRTVVPEVLESAENNLSPIMREHLLELLEEFRAHYCKAKELEGTIKDLCKQSEFFRRAQEELSGVGPLTASRFLSTIGHHSNYRNGRQVSAALGLVPRQYSSGGGTKLGSITKCGESRLRSLLVLGARAALARLSRKQQLGPEELRLKAEVAAKGHTRVAVQLANRNARQMWAIMKKCA